MREKQLSHSQLPAPVPLSHASARVQIQCRAYLGQNTGRPKPYPPAEGAIGVGYSGYSGYSVTGDARAPTLDV